MWNKDFCRTWVEALRSGKYVQGVKYLTTTHCGEEKDCCLGVACKLLKLPREKDVGEYFRYGVDRQPGVLPEAAQDFIGINSNTGRLSWKGKPDEDCDSYTLNLTDLNDNGFTFDQIADIISYEAGLNAE